MVQVRKLLDAAAAAIGGAAAEAEARGWLTDRERARVGVSGPELRARRIAAGVTGAAVAARAARGMGGRGGSVATALSKWECHDTHPGPRAAVALLEALNAIEAERGAAPPAERADGRQLLQRWAAIGRSLRRLSWDVAQVLPARTPEAIRQALYAWNKGERVAPDVAEATARVVAEAEALYEREIELGRAQAEADRAPDVRAPAGPTGPAMSLADFAAMPLPDVAARGTNCDRCSQIWAECRCPARW
jgi:hypothetical protein